MNRMNSSALAVMAGGVCITFLAGVSQGTAFQAPNGIKRFFAPDQLNAHSGSPLNLAEAFDALAAEADAQWVECSAFSDWAAQKGDADQLRTVVSLKGRVQDEFVEAAARIALDVWEWHRDPARYSGPSTSEFWQAYRALAQKRDAFRKEIIALRAEFYTRGGVELREVTTSNPFDFKRSR